MRLPSPPSSSPRTRSTVALGALASLLGLVSASWGLAFGCSFPDYVADGLPSGDTGGDVAIDTAPDAPVDTGPFVLTDGRVCVGHDEDGDGVPDECDNCPNVANPGLAGKDIGDACNASSLGFTSRLAFDPFTTFASGKWQYFGQSTGLFALGTDSDSVVGGNTTLLGAPDGDLRFVSGPIGASPGSAGVAVTAVLTITEEAGGTAGVLARIDGATGKQFFLCGLNSVGFALARPDPSKPCSGGACGPQTILVGDAGASTQGAIPADIPHGVGQKIGVRLIVSATTADAGTGDVECRVFDPSVAFAASTLQSGDPKYSFKVTVQPSRWISSGEVGMYAQTAKARFHSIDILKGP